MSQSVEIEACFVHTDGGSNKGLGDGDGELRESHHIAPYMLTVKK